MKGGTLFPNLGKNRGVKVLATLLGLSLLFAACGDDDGALVPEDPTSTSTTPPEEPTTTSTTISDPVHPCDGTTEAEFDQCFEEYTDVAVDNSNGILDYVRTKQNLDWMSDEEVVVDVAWLCTVIDFDGVTPEEAVTALSDDYAAEDNLEVDTLLLVPIRVAGDYVCPDLVATTGNASSDLIVD
jgi:hypothetical protein